jgi:GNAT superfamily N-acetyltransferase
MAVSEALTKVTLSLADVPGGLALSDAAGWNQTGDDWQLFIRHGYIVGYRNSEGRLVATAAALPYGGGAGWISMVLVAQHSRHQGLATQLLDGCVKTLQQGSAIPVLDATPAGAPVYRRLGFQVCFELARWEGDALAMATPVSDNVRVADADDVERMIALDAAANGIDRHFLLADFMSREGSRAWIARDGSGFVIARQGRRATQVGPLVAADEASAVPLLDAAVSGASGRAFLDVPERWTALASWLARRHFARQRPFVRMALVPAPVSIVNDRLFVLAGPEFG